MRTLRALAPLVAVVLLVAGCGSASKDASAKSTPSKTPSAKAVKHVIKVVYDEPTTNDDATAKEILQDGGVDGIASGFSDNFAFPVDLTIHATSGDGSPFYDPATKTVTLYYGFVNTTEKIIKAGYPRITDNELGKEWAAVDDFVLIHELGHAFVDVFDIPITGREEDAVDDMATVFFTDGVPNGAEYAFDAASFFHLLQNVQGRPDASQFQDEHSLSTQRAYDIACAVAGSSETTMQQMAARQILPPSRLARCPAEYAQKSKAWKALLKPHLRSSQTS
ncbi:MAG: hypothetical protein JWP74_1108 [Marmoricola sp.]|nr:hypothetical protein [Marmoricola sp.]